jgi:hypothetical protein
MAVGPADQIPIYRAVNFGRVREVATTAQGACEIGCRPCRPNSNLSSCKIRAGQGSEDHRPVLVRKWLSALPFKFQFIGFCYNCFYITGGYSYENEKNEKSAAPDGEVRRLSHRGASDPEGELAEPDA